MRRPLRRRAERHVLCSRENIAYIVWDTLSGDESRAGRADRLSAMGTDDASVLIDIVSWALSVGDKIETERDK